MRLVVAACALAVLLLPSAAAGERVAPGARTKTPESVLALERAHRSDFLVRVDGNSLRPLTRRLMLGGHAYAWSLSPDGKRVALGVDRALGIRIVDVRRLKRAGTVRTSNGNIFALAWLTPRRIVGVEETGLFAVDPVARRRLRSPELVGDILAVRRAPNLLVCVVAPDGEIGAARLAAVGADGDVRTVTLDPIRAGVVVDDETMRGESHTPGLAVDPAGRAFVVGGPGEPVAEIDLSTLHVTYHRPERSRSVLARLHGWLEPAAEAKVPLSGSRRQALWLRDGRLAVWGADSTPVGDRVETRSIGLSLVDTREWSLAVVDPDATQVALAGDTLLTVGDWNGLHGFSTSGGRRFLLFADENVGIAATFGSRAFVVPTSGPIRIVDAATGEQAGTRRRVPQLLHAEFSWW
jgi:hypothetical protein